MPIDPIAGLSAAEIIRLLDLHPHPEGGFFRETFRDPVWDARGRAVSTLIYYLLGAGQLSRWHKVDAAEVWHYYAGAALEIKISQTGVEQACTGWALILSLESARNTSSRRIAGKARRAWERGRLLAARLLLVSNSPALSLRHFIGHQPRPAKHRQKVARPLPGLTLTPWLQALRSASAADRAGVSFPRYRFWNFARQPLPKVRPRVYWRAFPTASWAHFQTG
jgi:predicted cupin superfamily sugar epimerase